MVIDGLDTNVLKIRSTHCYCDGNNTVLEGIKTIIEDGIIMMANVRHIIIWKYSTSEIE